MTVIAIHFLPCGFFFVHVIANSDFTLQFCRCRFCTITLRSVCIKTRLGDSAMSVLPMQPASRHVGLELTFLFFYMLGLPRCGFYGFKRVVCWCETCEDVVITVIGGVDCEHGEILCFSLKLMAGHSDYAGCVHCLSLSVLAQFAIKKLGMFHSFCGSSTLKPQGFVCTGHELPIRIAAADQCQDGLDKASLLHEFGLFLNPRNCSQCLARVLSLSICSQHCCLDSFQILWKTWNWESHS